MPDTYDAEDIAKILGIKRNTLYGWINKQLLPRPNIQLTPFLRGWNEAGKQELIDALRVAIANKRIRLKGLQV